MDTVTKENGVVLALLSWPSVMCGTGMEVGGGLKGPGSGPTKATEQSVAAKPHGLRASVK